ncbi:MAG TPA: histidinol dehydrogenase [Firmicutes bacterium]|nr:histidinol dehydrogenase [Bacillota bacterium]
MLAVQKAVANVLLQVKQRGDEALRDFTRQFDRVDRPSPLVSPGEKAAAWKEVPEAAIRDLEFAATRVREFARLQLEAMSEVEKEILPGVHVGHRLFPVPSAAVYVPGGRYPLPSTALMGIIPAREAGVERVVTCAPPDVHGSIDPYTLVAMQIAGADEIYCMGGAQAVAALAYGTEAIRPVDIIVGPGNQYVTEAKRQVAGTVAIDFLAGPSEVLVIADETAHPAYVAADLLAQCEHDPQARAVLVTTSRTLANEVEAELNSRLAVLPTAETARAAWEANGQVYLVANLEEAAALANEVAPEHLEVHVADWARLLPRLQNYGSLFLGEMAAEVFGDYGAGPNHILPTMGTARFSGGLWAGMFVKVVTHQRLTAEGVKVLAPVAYRLATLEGLAAHAAAAQVRLSGS